jgi:hypothetical protein
MVDTPNHTTLPRILLLIILLLNVLVILTDNHNLLSLLLSPGFGVDGSLENLSTDILLLIKSSISKSLLSPHLHPSSPTSPSSGINPQLASILNSFSTQ